MAIISRRIFLAFVCLATISAVLLCSGVQTATANVPVVISIENVSTGGKLIIKVSVNHVDGASVMMVHYTDIIEVDVNGKVTQFTNENALHDNPFVMQLDLGPLSGTPNVKARAHCNIHGWGDWSSPVAVPEFPVAALVSVVALAATLLIMKRQSQIRR